MICAPKMLNLRTDSYGNKLTGLGGSDWLVVIVFAPVIHGITLR
jgi:hypothetical protein